MTTTKRRTTKEPQVDPKSPLAPVVAEVRTQIRMLEESIPDDPREDDEGSRHVRSRIEGMEAVLTQIQRAGASGVVENGQRLVQVGGHANGASIQQAPPPRTRFDLLEAVADQLQNRVKQLEDRVFGSGKYVLGFHGAADAERPARAMPAILAPAAKKTVTEPKSIEKRLLTACERACLSVLAQRTISKVATTWAQLAILSRYSQRSSTFVNAVSGLRVKGLLEGSRADMRTTTIGIGLAGPLNPLPKGTELLSMWIAQLTLAEGKILRALYDADPDALTAETLSERTGYSTSSSTFANAVSKCRVLGLAERGWPLRISDAFR